MNSKILNIKEVRLVSKFSNLHEIKKICFLKDKEWKFGIKSQLKWYRNNIKKNDIHNFLYIRSNLIGYTALRIKTYKTNELKKNQKYLLFDTLIIDKKYRNHKLSRILMNFNNFIIEQSRYFSFLICKKVLLNFYIKFGWLKIKKKDSDIFKIKPSYCGMTFNKK